MGNETGSAGDDAVSASAEQAPAIRGARDLGLASLADLIEVSLDGIVLADLDGYILYANPAAVEIIGYPPAELVGRHFSSSMAERDQAELRRLHAGLVRGVAARATITLLRPDGEEREIDMSISMLHGATQEYMATIFRDVTAPRRLEREGVALMQIASQVAFGGSLEATLGELCRHMVGVSRAVAAAVILLDIEKGQPRMVGTYGLPEGYADISNRMIAANVPVLSVETMAERRPSIRRGVRANLLAAPTHTLMHPYMHVVDWDTIVAVPMSYRDEVVGALLSYYLPDDEVGERELGFHIALANQAAVAVENARLLAQVHEKAALEERQRMARELHDSVSQSLYSLSLQARAARILLDRDPGRVQEPLDEVLVLSRAALAEMRALLFALRPGALREEGLLEAVRKHAAGVEARERITVLVSNPGSGLPRLKDEAEDALYRIVQEALHNAVKHAQATQVQITIALEGDSFVARVSDDGVGFDPAQVGSGQMGLGTMGQRAAALDGEFQVQSAPGQGATVEVRLPLAAWQLALPSQG